MVAVGHLVGYGFSALDLSRIFGTLIGDTQFKQVCVIAAFALIVAVGVTCWAVDERVLVLNEFVLFFFQNALRMILIRMAGNKVTVDRGCSARLYRYTTLRKTYRDVSKPYVGFNSGLGLVSLGCDEGAFL